MINTIIPTAIYREKNGSLKDAFELLCKEHPNMSRFDIFHAGYQLLVNDLLKFEEAEMKKMFNYFLKGETNDNEGQD